jgi:hypothetical protein
MSNPKNIRPPLKEALAAWTDTLEKQGLPTKTLWIFAENLCIEQSRATPGSYRIGYQTKFSPPDENALEVAFEHFAATDARLVFYRLGSSPRGSVCVLLCDPWFEEKNSRDGFERRDDWGISFYAGHPGDIEEVTDLSRWVRRVKRDRAFHDFDFAMSLETVDELIIHGRTLQPYERFAQRMMDRLRRILGDPE